MAGPLRNQSAAPVEVGDMQIASELSKWSKQTDQS